MKRLRHVIMIVFREMTAGFWSCESYLDVPPEASVYEEDIFGTYLTFQDFLDPIYNMVFDYNNHAICCSQNLGGEALGSKGWVTADITSRGDYWAIVQNALSNFIGYNDEGIWDYSWQGIRICNIQYSKTGPVKC